MIYLALEFLNGLGYGASPKIEEGKTYDIISAIQVLEHLLNPDSMIADISKTIKPVCRFLLAVPNGGEISKCGPTWIGFMVDHEHINYFSLKTLSQLLIKHNIYIEQYW